MPQANLPRNRSKGGETAYRGGASYVDAKAQFVELYRLTGKRGVTMELADSFITWPNFAPKPPDRVLLGWIQQYDEGNYDPPAKISMRFAERWNNAFKDAYREMGLAGVETSKQLLEMMRNGTLKRPVELLYAKDAAYVGADGTRMLRELEPAKQARTVGSVRLITPVAQKQLAAPKGVTIKRRVRNDKKLAAMREIEGEFREVG